MSTGDPRGVTITGYFDATHITKNFGKTSKFLKSEAASLSKTTSKLVNEKMGKSMSRFNEKTEKGRQLMTAFGGTMGAAGGQVTYYAGTISYVIGQFEKWELVTMGVMGGVAALMFKMGEMAAGPMQELLKATDKLIEETDKLRESVRKMIETEVAGLVGLTKFEGKILEIRSKRYDLEIQLTNLEAQRRVAIEKGTWAEALAAGKLEDRISKVRNQMSLLTAQIAQVSAVGEASAAKAGAGAAGKAAGGLKAGAMGPDFFMFLKAQQAEDKARRKAEEDRLKMIESSTNNVINLRARQLKREFDTVAYWEDRMTRHKEREELKRQENMLDIANMGVEAFSALSDTFLKNEEARTAAKVAAILVEAGIQSAMEFAKGWAAIASYQYPAAAAHFTSAALFAAVGIGKAVGAGGGGGSSAGTRGDRQGQSPEAQSLEPRETTIIVQLGGREVGRAVHDSLEGYYDQRNPGRTRRRVG